jgi:hypothetical protein
MVQISQNVINITTTLSSDDVTTKNYVDGYVENERVKVNGFSVSDIATDSFGTLLLPTKSAAITVGSLAPGGVATTLWTLPTSAYQNITVEAILSASSDDGYAGGHLDGTIICTAKRFKNGSLTITSQSAALPWALNKTAWLPQFVPSGNNLLLQITPDTSDTIQIRDSFVRYTVKNTSNDLEPQAYDIFSATVKNIFPTTLIDQFITPTYGADVTSWTGTEGNILTNVVGTHFSAATLGTMARPAITSTVGLLAELRADLGSAVKCLIIVAAAPDLPIATYSVLGNIGVQGSVTNILMVSTSQTVLSANNIIKVDGVTTNTVPSAGGVHVFQLDVSGSSETSIGVGFANNPFPWREKVGYVLALSAVPSNGDVSSLLTAVGTYFNG